MKRIVFVLSFLLTAFVSSNQVWSAPLVVDLSESLIRVNVGFDGDEVLMFGAAKAPNPDAPVDLIVTVMGPRESYQLRKKARKLGLWINGAPHQLDNAPSFYTVASTRPLASILDEASLSQIEAGADRIQISPAHQEEGPEQDAKTLERKAAFIRNMQRSGLYSATEQSIVILGNQLFRAPIQFPSNVSTGAYQVQAHLVQEGKIVFSTGAPLAVRKVGQEAQIYAFAHNQALLYGIICVLLALIWGYASFRVFRKL